MSNLDVIGLGALNMDYLYRVDRILEDGETVVEQVISAPGGSAANTIYGLARLGMKTGFAGAVGDDADGEAMVQDFRRAGVDAGHVKAKKAARTGSALCLSDPAGRRSIYIVPGANNLLSRDDLDLAYLNSGRLLHLSSFVHDQQFELCREILPGLTTALSFSPGSLYVKRGLDALAPFLKRSRVLFLNAGEIRRLTGMDVVPAAEVCLKLGCQVVAVTLGSGMPFGKESRQATAYIRDSDYEYVVEPVSRDATPVVDATGAGDAFAAGFLYGLLDGRPLLECGRTGDIAARFCIAQVGARTGLPARAQLEQRYRELYGGER